MMAIKRTCLSLLILCVLLVACGKTLASGGNGDHHSSVKVDETATTTPMVNSNTTTCPTSVRRLSGCLTPYEIRTAYGIEPLLQQGITGKGQTIVDIVSFGSPTLKQDMDVFDQAFGLPPVDLQVISPLNEAEYDPHHDKAGWAQETELDVQIIHSIAPGAKIVILTSPVAETEGTTGLPEFRQLEQYVIDHNIGSIVSQSWGASELTLQDAQGQQELQKWNTLFQQGTTQHGITYFSSSGDNGATDYIDTTQTQLGKVATTSFATDSPWVTSVGGTTLKRQSNGSFQETGWSSSGGGFSHFYPTPDFQKTLPSTTLTQFNNRRGVPDVAAVADPFTGLAIYLNGQWTLAGGTSASAPIWAGVMALVNQKAGHALGFINPGLYKLAASDTYNKDFNDITQGNNSNTAANVQGYSATSGWDAITGLGSPNAVNLVPNLIAITKP